MVGGDTSGMDDAIDRAIADLQKGDEEGGGAPDGPTGDSKE
jgi:hypothetical protein